MVRRDAPRVRDPHPELALGGLPLAPGRPPAGVPATGQTKPTPHELAILRRLARPGGFVLVTLRGGEPPLFLYGDGGEVITGAGTKSHPGKALSPSEFRRLSRWLTPVRGEDLFDLGIPQRWVVKRPDDWE